MSFYTVDKPGKTSSVVSSGDMPYRVRSVLNTHLHSRQSIKEVHLPQCLHE